MPEQRAASIGGPQASRRIRQRVPALEGRLRQRQHDLLFSLQLQGAGCSLSDVPCCGWRPFFVVGLCCVALVWWGLRYVLLLYHSWTWGLLLLAVLTVAVCFGWAGWAGWARCDICLWGGWAHLTPVVAPPWKQQSLCVWVVGWVGLTTLHVIRPRQRCNSSRCRQLRAPCKFGGPLTFLTTRVHVQCASWHEDIMGACHLQTCSKSSGALT
jgi:hypothetical protein